MIADTEPASLSDRIRLAGLKARLLTLGDLDKRTSAYRRAQGLISAMAADLGGDDQITTTQRLLIGRAAIAAVMTEDQETRYLAGAPIDPAVHATLSNSLRRLLLTIGLSRVPKNIPTLAEHLAALAQKESAGVADDDDDDVDVADQTEAANGDQLRLEDRRPDEDEEDAA